MKPLPKDQYRSTGAFTKELVQSMNRHQGLTVALLPWGNVIEDFLCVLGVSLEKFCSEMRGGWLFGYVEALQRSGSKVVVFCVSASVQRVTTFTHAPTGAPIVVLPALRSYRSLRRRIHDPYAWEIKDVVGKPSGPRRQFQAAVLRGLCLYLATPLRLLARELRRTGCTAVLCQEYEYARFDACVLLGLLLKLPVFASFQGGDWQMSWLERPIRSISIRASAGLIVPTSTEASRVVARYGVPEARIARIFNPLDIELWSPIEQHKARAVLAVPTEARVAIWHGRVDMYRKGLDVLLYAWEKVVARHPGEDLRLLLVGTGADATVLRGILKAKKVPNVQWRDEYLLDRGLMRCYLSAANVFVFPSRHEGFPVAPLEAMACGLPVVATNTPGIQDIFERGKEQGGIVVPRDDPEALAAALGELLNAPGRARELGSRARRRVQERFSLAAVGKQLRSFIELSIEARYNDVKVGNHSYTD